LFLAALAFMEASSLPESTPPGGPASGSTAALAAQLFAQKTEAELLYLAQHAARYPPAVGAAAVAELQRRGLVPEAVRAAAPLAPPPAETWGQVLRGMFVPSRTFFATPILLQLNVLVFFVMVVSGVSASEPSGPDLVAWGSNFTPLTLHGQPWRLVSNIFLHAGFSHLLLNMFSLWLLGVLIEARIGGWRLLLGYFVSGIGASLTSLLYNSLGINSVGASGAIFGLYGMLLVLLLSKRLALDKSDRKAMLGLVLYLVLSNLISGLTGGNIDNAAHIGGLLTGLLLAGPLVLFRLPAPTK
jgi:rhomboid protease GluP